MEPDLTRHKVDCREFQDRLEAFVAGTLDAEKVPASYRTLIAGGWVHHFNWSYGVRHHKAQPATFGTLKSKLWPVLEKGHYDVKLTRDEMRRVKCWIDLNCPLWPDYVYRATRER